MIYFFIPLKIMHKILINLKYFVYNLFCDRNVNRTYCNFAHAVIFDDNFFSFVENILFYKILLHFYYKI